MDLASAPHTLVLPIDPDWWAPPPHGIEVDGVDYAPKTELHVTLIGSRLGRELHTTLAPVFLRDQLRMAMEDQDWRIKRTGRFVQLAHTRHLGLESNPGTRESIIELIELPAMALLHQALGRLLGRQTPVPPPHVTLYTANGPQGIGLSSPSQLRARRVRALLPESRDGLS